MPCGHSGLCAPPALAQCYIIILQCSLVPHFCHYGIQTTVSVVEILVCYRSILITKATEPSWTPIFTNAAGVIMEIGGPLQHGGIIAREYGIPCVSGLSGIMDIINDGDLVEVDGTNGVVRILDQNIPSK